MQSPSHSPVHVKVLPTGIASNALCCIEEEIESEEFEELTMQSAGT